MDAYGPEFSAIYNRRWDLWARKVWPYLTSLDNVGESGVWLDLCCGSGLLLKLADKRGYTTFGIDQSERQVAFAREKAPAARITQGDICAIEMAHKFDVITCMFDSLNYLALPEDFATAVRRAADHLAPDGIFVFDVKTAHAFQTEEGRIFRDKDHVVIFQSSYDTDTALHRFDVNGFVREGDRFRRFDEEHIQRGYDFPEVESVLRDAGLYWEKCDGNTFEPIQEDPKRILYVCQNNQTI